MVLIDAAHRRRLCVGLVLAAWPAALACRPTSEPAPDTASGAAMRETAAAGPERLRMLGSFLAEHWVLPIPLQGDPPAHFSSAEASLDPEEVLSNAPRREREFFRVKAVLEE